MKINSKTKINKGFALLFSIMLSSIILAVALGIASISFKEIQFGTSAEQTNDAFYAADTGAECALFNDKASSTTFSASSSGSIDCGGVSGVHVLVGAYPIFSFVVSQLGDPSSQKACAKITVDKTGSATHIIALGYNVGSNPGIYDVCNPPSNSVERRLDFNY